MGKQGTSNKVKHAKPRRGIQMGDKPIYRKKKKGRDIMRPWRDDPRLDRSKDIAARVERELDIKISDRVVMALVARIGELYGRGERLLAIEQKLGREPAFVVAFKAFKAEEAFWRRQPLERLLELV